MMTHIKNFFQKHNLRPFQSIYLMIVHILAIIGLIYVCINSQYLMKTFLALCIIHNLGAIGITAGAHRLWSHRAYSASFIWKFVVMLLNSNANQGSIFHWSRDHRLHHKFSDTDLDPHTIKNGFFFSHVGWLLKKKSAKLVQQGRKIDMSDLQKDSIVMFQKRHYLLLSLTMCIIIPSLVYYNMVGIPSIFFSICLSYLTYTSLLNATWCVNSVCHMFGSRKYNPNIEPRDNFFVSLITAGQGYHNWHHQYPSCWKASKDQWWMINITARLIELGSVVGLTKVKM